MRKFFSSVNVLATCSEICTAATSTYNANKLSGRLFLIFLSYLIMPNGFGQLFEQNFNSSTLVSSYISASPGNGQFNAISTTGAGVVISINSNKLSFDRSGNANLGSFSRTTDFLFPTSIMYKFDLAVTGSTTSTTSAAVFQVGSGFGTSNSVEANANIFARFGINTTTTNGTFQIRDITNGTNSINLSGPQTILWVMNSSGFPGTYRAPGGISETIATGKADIWAGMVKIFNDVNVQTPAQLITDLKFIISAGNPVIEIDNLLIDKIPIIPNTNAPTNKTATSFTANWSGDIAGATGYRIDVAIDAGFTTFAGGYNDLYVPGKSTSSLNITGLTPSTQYYYRVRTAAQYTTGEFAGGNSESETLITCDPLASPTITPGGATTFCSGGSVVLTSSVATGNQWYKNGVEITGASGSTYQATTSGSYTVAVTTTGCVSQPSDAVQVTINSKPTSGTLTKTPNLNSVCSGSIVSATLTTQGTGGSNDILQYRFDDAVNWNTYTDASNLSTTGHTLVEIRTYRSAGFNCESTPNKVSWTVSDCLPTCSNPPMAVITNNTGSTELTCSGKAINVTASGGVIYSWDGGTSPASAANTFTEPGTYTVTVTDVNNCTDVESITITQNITSPAVSITGATKICINATTQLSPVSGGTWVSNDPSVASIFNTGLVTGLSAGAATFTFTLTSTGCRNTTSAVSVNSKVSAGTVSGSSKLCMGVQTTYSSDGIVGGTWSSSDGSVASVDDDVSGEVTTLKAGKTVINYTINSGCGSPVSSSIDLIVNPVPVCMITGPPGPVCPGSNVTFSGPPGMHRYSWSITGNGTIPTGSAGPSVIVTAGQGCNASYTLSLIVQDEIECSSTCNTTINVTRSGGDKGGPRLKPGAILPPGIGNINSCSPVGGATIEEIKKLYEDNCGGAVIVVKSGMPTGNSCGWSVAYTYRITDICGNAAQDVVIIYSGRDQTVPALTGSPFAGTSGINSCKSNAIATVPFNAAQAIQGYSDNCGGTVTATLTGATLTGTDCNWTVTYTFTIKDICGNLLPGRTYTNKGNDKTPPVNSCPADITVNPTNINGAIVNYSKTAGTDNCGNVTTVLTGKPSGSLFPIGTTLNTFVVTDACGNSATCSFTVTVTDPYCDKKGKDNKVYVCHNGSTLCINVNALQAHLNHGDVMGECNSIVRRTFGEPVQANIEIFPNPSTGQIKVQLNNFISPGATIRIFDQYGNMVSQKLVIITGKEFSVPINLANHASGMFNVQVLSQDGTKNARVVIGK